MQLPLCTITVSQYCIPFLLAFTPKVTGNKRRRPPDVKSSSIDRMSWVETLTSLTFTRSSNNLKEPSSGVLGPTSSSDLPRVETVWRVAEALRARRTNPRRLRAAIARRDWVGAHVYYNFHMTSVAYSRSPTSFAEPAGAGRAFIAKPRPLNFL